MPYANNTAFARQTREYIKTKRRLPEKTTHKYQTLLEMIGERMEWKAPREITITDMENLESGMMAEYSESTIALCLWLLKDLLEMVGNNQSKRFKSLCSMQPARDSVYLTEEQMAKGRLLARSRSNTTELLFSLMVDNGLRPVDVERLTIRNARELMESGRSVILGKGRNGGKEALMVMSPMTRKPLMIYLTERRKIANADQFEELFITKGKDGLTRPFTRHYTYQPVREILLSLGLDASPKDLRKTCGNRVYRETHDIAMSALILRHNSPGTSFRHYIGANESDQRDIQLRLAQKCPDWESQQANGQETFLLRPDTLAEL